MQKKYWGKQMTNQSGDDKVVSGEETQKGAFKPEASEVYNKPVQPQFKSIFTSPTVSARPVVKLPEEKLQEQAESITDLVGDMTNVKSNASSESIQDVLGYLKKPVIVGGSLPKKEPTDVEQISAFKVFVKKKFKDLADKFVAAKEEFTSQLGDAQSLVNEVNMTIGDVVNALPESVRETHKTELENPVSALYFVAKYLGTMNTVIDGLNSRTNTQGAKIVHLEDALKTGQKDYEAVEQNMRKYETVVDFLINLASKPQYAGRLKASDTKFLEDAKKGSSADLPKYVRLLNLLSQFVDEDLAQIEILVSEDEKYKSLDADYKNLRDEHAVAKASLETLEKKANELDGKYGDSLNQNKRLFNGIKDIADKYACRKDLHATAAREIEVISAQNAQLRESAAQTSKFLEEAFADFDAYIAEIEKSME